MYFFLEVVVGDDVRVVAVRRLRDLRGVGACSGAAIGNMSEGEHPFRSPDKEDLPASRAIGNTSSDRFVLGRETCCSGAR